MCSRARRRSVWMSERKAPLAITFLSCLLGRATRCGLPLGRGVLRLDVGLFLLVLGLGFLLAGALFLALVPVALLLRYLVLVLGLGLIDLAGMRLRGLVFVLELRFGDVLLALGVGFAHFLLVALHVAALRLGGFVVGLDLVAVGLLLRAVDARLRAHGALRLCGARAR